MVGGAYKDSGVQVPLGLFLDDQASEVSAVVYSCLATWGKLRALADNPLAQSVYKTLHPAKSGIIPEMRVACKKDYREHLIDGLYIFHNPFAKHPLSLDALGHARASQMFVENGTLVTIAPDDFLLMRMIHSITVRDD